MPEAYPTGWYRGVRACVCGPMGVSHLLLGGIKSECGMSIALIVSNPQRRWRATSACCQGKAKIAFLKKEEFCVACLCRVDIVA